MLFMNVSEIAVTYTRAIYRLLSFNLNKIPISMISSKIKVAFRWDLSICVALAL